MRHERVQDRNPECGGKPRGAGKWIRSILAMAAVASLMLAPCGCKPRETAPLEPENKIAAQVRTSTDAAATDTAARELKLPRLLDLGAHSCIPCKMMAPILEELKKEYAGAFKTDFIDVWKNPDAGKQHGIQAIPTQIFFDAEGKERYRHTGFLLGVGRLPVPWQALLLSILVYVALPLVCGFFSRIWIIRTKGERWFKEKFLHVLTPVTIIALLTTLVLLFSFKGETILANPLTILWIAIPLFIQTMLIFWLGYGAARLLKLSYRDAAPAAMIGASNHFEVAIATATMLFGLSSGAALATVVGVLIEVPVMLWLVKICRRTEGWFGSARV